LGTKLTDNDIEKLLQGKIITKTLKKDDKSWKQKLQLDGSYKLEFVKEEDMLPDVVCPICGSGIKITEKYYLCENYKKPDCSFLIGKECFGAKLTQTDAVKLISGKRVKKKLKSKAGKDYEAFLVLKGGRVQLEFE
jgi:DNA topoisomerase-3